MVGHLGMLVQHPGNGNLHPADDFIDIVQVGPFGRINIDVNVVGLNGGEKLHRPFHANCHQPQQYTDNQHGKCAEQHLPGIVQHLPHQTAV